VFKITGFRLAFIPAPQGGGRNDVKKAFLTFYEVIHPESLKYSNSHVGK